MLDITIPFSYRKHVGEWKLIGDNGMAVVPDVAGGLKQVEPFTNDAILTESVIELMCVRERMNQKVINLVAAPVPTCF